MSTGKNIKAYEEVKEQYRRYEYNAGRDALSIAKWAYRDKIDTYPLKDCDDVLVQLLYVINTLYSYEDQFTTADRIAMSNYRLAAIKLAERPSMYVGPQHLQVLCKACVHLISLENTIK